LKYTEILKDLLHDYNFVERDRYSKDDFVTIICPEHGIYYKSVGDILKDDPECPRCNFLSPDRGINLLSSYQLEGNFDPKEERALYYRLLIQHKKTGLLFQKVGIAKSSEDFIDFWDPWKWKDFTIEPIDKIECSLSEAMSIVKDFQQNNSENKMIIPNDIKFNMNKTYYWNEIWQAKAKTIPILRDIKAKEQKGKCTICDKPIKAPTLDHMHIKRIHGTGYIRAVCCSQCNTFIARSENNASRHGISNEELPDVLRRMADHLENQTNIIHPTEVPKRKKVGVREWNRIKKYYFKVFPNRKILPQKPTYITDSWLELKQQVDIYLEKLEEEKTHKKKLKQRHKRI